MASTAVYQADVVIAGGGLAGISAATELIDHGLNVVILERGRESSFGGLAKESFGGIMLVDTPLQRKSGIKDSPELAFRDWLRVADFGEEDHWPRVWAETYVNRSMELIFPWLTTKNVKFLPVVNWPERGLIKTGNSVPRWHIAWGTGLFMMNAIIAHLERHPHAGRLKIFFEHSVNEFIYKAGRISGCKGVLSETDGNQSDFEARGDVVIIASGGICGGDLSMVRKNWYHPWGNAPDALLNGSHVYADGMLHQAAESIGANLTHMDKQWHYAAGIHHPKAGSMKNKGLSLVPPRGALWMDATGKRFGPLPLMGYTDTRHLVETVCKTKAKYSWLILNWKIAIRELAVSGCDYMEAFRDMNKIRLLRELILGNRKLARTLIESSVDFVTAYSLRELANKMNQVPGNTEKVDPEQLINDVSLYDAAIARGRRFHNEEQLRRIADFRTYTGDRLRMCKFQAISDPNAGPLIAIRSFILSRKSLGGIQTDDACRVLQDDGTPIDGFFAIGETAGFGGGGIHGKGSLEGTFLGGCILTGRIAGHYIAKGKT